MDIELIKVLKVLIEAIRITVFKMMTALKNVRIVYFILVA